MQHLYLHVPFCVRRCSYCDFSIAVRKRIPAREYVDAVLRELELLRDSPGWADPGAVPRGGPERAASTLETLYLGGGTPSLLPAEELTRLITSLFDAFRSSPSLDDVEVTLDDVEVTLDDVEVTLDAVEVTLEAN